MVLIAAVSVLMIAGDIVISTSDTIIAAWCPLPSGELLFSDISNGDNIYRLNAWYPLLYDLFTNVVLLTKYIIHRIPYYLPI